MHVDTNKLLEFLKDFIVFDDNKKDRQSITDMDEWISEFYNWDNDPVDYKTCSDVAIDLGLNPNSRSVVTSIGFSLNKKGLTQKKSNKARKYHMPPIAQRTKMINYEERANLYKQECVNVRSDLCDLQNLICESAQNQDIEEQTSRDILDKIRVMIDAINEIFARIERD